MSMRWIQSPHVVELVEVSLIINTKTRIIYLSTIAE